MTPTWRAIAIECRAAASPLLGGGFVPHGTSRAAAG